MQNPTTKYCQDPRKVLGSPGLGAQLPSFPSSVIPTFIFMVINSSPFLLFVLKSCALVLHWLFSSYRQNPPRTSSVSASLTPHTTLVRGIHVDVGSCGVFIYFQIPHLFPIFSYCKWLRHVSRIAIRHLPEGGIAGTWSMCAFNSHRHAEQFSQVSLQFIFIFTSVLELPLLRINPKCFLSAKFSATGHWYPTEVLMSMSLRAKSLANTTLPHFAVSANTAVPLPCKSSQDKFIFMSGFCDIRAHVQPCAHTAWLSSCGLGIWKSSFPFSFVSRRALPSQASLRNRAEQRKAGTYFRAYPPPRVPLRSCSPCPQTSLCSPTDPTLGLTHTLTAFPSFSLTYLTRRHSCLLPEEQTPFGTSPAHIRYGMSSVVKSI